MRGSRGISLPSSTAVSGKGWKGMAGGITYHPIGVIRTEHEYPDKTPIQSVYASGCRGRAEILPNYTEGLSDLEGFSHIYLIYDFHLAERWKLMVKPFLQDVERGVFATRAPCRPNRIGLSIVRLLYRRGNVLYLDGVDILDGSPLLDIKPYVARFDRIEHTYNGWQDGVDDETAHQKGKRGYDNQETDPARTRLQGNSPFG
jgi:tRNA-Thr(GGU) m(6)t(6)A37 methyltransferase TsaA